MNGVFLEAVRCYREIAKVNPGLHWWTSMQLFLLVLSRGATALLAYALSVFVNEKMSIDLFGAAFIGVVSFFCFSKFLEWFLSGVHGRIHSYIVLPAGLNFVDTAIFKMLSSYQALRGFKSPVEMSSLLNKKVEAKNFLGFLFNHILGPVVELIVCAVLLSSLGFGWISWLLIPVCLVHLFVSMSLIPKVKSQLMSLLSISSKSVSVFSGALEKANLAQVFGSTNLLLEHLKVITSKETKELRRLYVLNDLMAVLVALPLAIFSCLFFYLGSVRVEEGLSTYGGFAALMGVVFTTFSQLRNLTFAFDGLSASLVSLKPHLELMELPGVLEDSRKVLPGSPLIKLNGYRVALPERVLFDVSLELLPGEKLYLVGQSGVGKTSFVRGLLGFQGYLGEVLINMETVGVWRNVFAWMPQETAALEGSVALNLRLGKPDATPEEMELVLRKVGLWQRVCDLGGLDSDLLFNGSNFSGGENQRLSLARALLSDNPVLLLDEPSSALDLNLEKEIFEHIESSDKSAIIIVHRLKAIPKSARVLFLQKDKPFILGKLSDLLETSDEFKDFYNVDERLD